MRKRVYIAGPYSKGDVMLNIRNAVWIGDKVWEWGGAPYVPHLSGFWHAISPHEYTDWLALDMAWLEVCDAVFRLAGDSAGADKEVERAAELGKPVFYDLGKLKGWLENG